MGLFSLTDLEYMFYAALRNGSVGTIGAKGDPGGIVKGTLLVTGTDLNTIKADGLYYSPRTSEANGLTLNYPHAIQTAGILQVGSWFNTNVDVIQIWTAARVVAGSYRTISWRRTCFNGTWTGWELQTNSRVDQTAGRAIYQWDDLNNREQLIYGDTGWREFPVPVVADKTVSGNVRIRRRGSEVELWFVDVVLSPNATGYCTILLSTDIPAGFKGSSNTRTMQAVGLQNNALTMQVITNFLEIAWTHSISGTALSTTRPTVGLSGTIKWTTEENWPTSLPGSAYGTIPNL
jgi:hypothetical protein